MNLHIEDCFSYMKDDSARKVQYCNNMVGSGANKTLSLDNLILEEFKQEHPNDVNFMPRYAKDQSDFS